MSNYQFKNILVTGSAGFIGCNFTRYLLDKYHNIRIVSLDKLTYAGSIKNLVDLKLLDNPRHVFVQGDICDRVLIDTLLHNYNIDTIVHFAAESHVDRSIAKPADFIQTNIVGTFILLEAARNFWLEEKKLHSDQCRFHHISTDEVYGELKFYEAPFTESTPYSPSSPYSASKASSDHLVRSYSRTYNLPITLSNCSNNYGPYQHIEKLIPKAINCCIEKTPISIYGNGSNVRDWLHVEDHCSAIDAILRYGEIGETYNIGGNCEINNLALIKIICTLMDEIKPTEESYKKLITFVPDRPGHDLRYAIDNSKILKELQWLPQYSIDVGMMNTINYYKSAYQQQKTKGA